MPAHINKQVRPGAAQLLQAFVEAQDTVQLGVCVYQQAFAGKACELAKAIGSGGLADADRQHGDASRLQLRQGRDQGLGVFDAVEIP